MIFILFFSRSKHATDVGLIDPNIIESCFSFYSTVCTFMLYLIEDRPMGDHYITPMSPQKLVPTELWSALPEWYIEDIADFILFVTQ